MRKIVLLMGLCLIVFAIAWSWVGWLWSYGKPLPEQRSVSVWLPKDAEIRSSQEVQPGTFKVNLSLAEFQEKAALSGQRVLVAWGVQNPVFSTEKALDYWLPREVGAFYHYRNPMPSEPDIKISFPQNWAIVWDQNLSEETNSVIYTSRAYPIMFFTVGVVVAMVGILMMWFAGAIFLTKLFVRRINLGQK